MFPNKPREATHFIMHEGWSEPGGNWVYRVNFFRKVDGNWMLYKTDTDNEYSGWSLAEPHYRNGCFEKVKEKIKLIP